MFTDVIVSLQSLQCQAVSSAEDVEELERIDALVRDDLLLQK